MRLLARGLGAVALGAIMVVACGDPESSTGRGPTKAPGDSVPLFVIRNEEPTAMRALGQPNLPSSEPLAFPELDSAAQAASASGQAAAPAGGQAAAPAVALPAGVAQAMVGEGKQVFDTSCFACHGQAGAGGPLAPKLADSQWLHIDGSYDAIVSLVNVGVPKPKQYPAPMPPKGGAPLTDAQVRAVAAYVFSISR